MSHRVASFTILIKQTDDGLPQNSVISIAQTPDGCLWLATFNGLVRFDGVRFKVFDPENVPALTSSRITLLFADRRGGLWIATEEGGLIVRQQGAFRTLPTTNRVWAFTERKDGIVWITTAKGLYEWRGDTLRPAQGPMASFQKGVAPQTEPLPMK
ncbi:MAG: two-component regulator propeller domain-containing protein [Verrucomicrobiota bacterium]